MKGVTYMKEKHKELAEKIIGLVGGKENVQNLIHCQTRLRFDLIDTTKANQKKLKQLDGVAGVIDSGGQFQVVIGTHVEEVYNDMVPLLDNFNESSASTVKKKKNILNAFYY